MIKDDIEMLCEESDFDLVEMIKEEFNEVKEC